MRRNINISVCIIMNKIGGGGGLGFLFFPFLLFLLFLFFFYVNLCYGDHVRIKIIIITLDT